AGDEPGFETRDQALVEIRNRLRGTIARQDSYDESCILELHARVDMDGLVREYADSILERRARDQNILIEGEVLTCIANLVANNVRELGGAFNRVDAFSSLMHGPLTQDLAR